jgi:phosphoribosylformimino-5-aminoimidazole carboxamide ribonucleotide (ProFAR) isomerase
MPSGPRAVQFRPCIDIHQGRVKQIVGGTLKDSADGKADSETPETNFETETSSAEFARMYQRDGIFGGHVIMLSRDDGTTQAAMDAVSAFPGGLQVGGGVTAETAMPLIDAGASHVIVTSYVFRDGIVDQDAPRRHGQGGRQGEAGARSLMQEEGRRLLRRHGQVAEVDGPQGGRSHDGVARVLSAMSS